MGDILFAGEQKADDSFCKDSKRDIKEHDAEESIFVNHCVLIECLPTNDIPFRVILYFVSEYLRNKVGVFSCELFSNIERGIPSLNKATR